MKKIILGFTFTSFFSGIIAMDGTHPRTHLVVVPGQNELGGQNTDIVLPQYALASLKAQPPIKRYTATTPLTWRSIDLGQKHCKSHLQKTFTDNNLQAPVIIHGSSQGTATTINYVAQNPTAAKALILESVLLTGNSAIHHTVKKSISGWLASVPGSYYWIPYFAKILYPGYAPAGEQAIANIDKLPTDLPIIILHDENDRQLSFEDSQALYAYFKQIKNNKNVYFIPHQTQYEGQIYAGHVELLDMKNMQAINAINTILHNNNILTQDPDYLEGHDTTAETSHYHLKKYESAFGFMPPRVNQEKYEELKSHYLRIAPNTIDLSQYQPKVQPEWLAHFENLQTKENRLWYFDKALKTSIVSLIVYLLHRAGYLDTIVETFKQELNS